MKIGIESPMSDVNRKIGKKHEDGRHGPLQDIGKALRVGSALTFQPRVPQRAPI